MIVAFASKKGGVAKTTTAVNVAAALARLGQRTLLVDLDPQASASLSVGVPRAELAPSIADALAGHTPIEQAVRGTFHGNLDLLTASTDLSRLEEDLSTYRARERVLANQLEDYREVYDYILIDCPAGLSLLTRCAVVAADGLVVPLQPQYLALEGLDNLIAAAERISFNNGNRIRFLGILPTLVDYRTRVTREVITNVREQYGEKVFAVEVRVNVRLAEAPALGQTIFEYDHECAGAQAYDLVAEELLMRCRFGWAPQNPMEHPLGMSEPASPASNGQASPEEAPLPMTASERS